MICNHGLDESIDAVRVIGCPICMAHVHVEDRTRIAQLEALLRRHPIDSENWVRDRDELMATALETYCELDHPHEYVDNVCRYCGVNFPSSSDRAGVTK